MTQRIDSREITRELTARIDQVVPALLPAAVKRNGYWYCGDVSGSPGKSLFIGTRADRVGRRAWTDGATDDGGSLIDLIMRVQKLPFIDALKWALDFLGGRAQPPSSVKRSIAANGETDVGEAQRMDWALSLWNRSKPARATPAEIYLRNRGITCTLPADLRFNAECFHAETGLKLPALVALIRDIGSNRPCGVQRTYITDDGLKAPVSNARITLGRAHDAVIKLAPDETVEQGLGIAEGCETGLSLISLGWASIWAVGSAGAIRNFPIISVDALTIFADADGPGLEAARICQRRWTDVGREARIIYPREPGYDWNDAIRSAA